MNRATIDRAGYAQTFADADVNGLVGNSAIGGPLPVTGMLSGTGVVDGEVLATGVHAPGNSSGNSPVAFDRASGITARFSNLSLGGSLLAGLACSGYLSFRRRRSD